MKTFNAFFYFFLLSICFGTASAQTVHVVFEPVPIVGLQVNFGVGDGPQIMTLDLTQRREADLRPGQQQLTWAVAGADERLFLPRVNCEKDTHFEVSPTALIFAPSQDDTCLVTFSALHFADLPEFHISCPRGEMCDQGVVDTWADYYVRNCPGGKVVVKGIASGGSELSSIDDRLVAERQAQGMTAIDAAGGTGYPNIEERNGISGPAGRGIRFSCLTRPTPEPHEDRQSMDDVRQWLTQELGDTSKPDGCLYNYRNGRRGSKVWCPTSGESVVNNITNVTGAHVRLVTSVDGLLRRGAPGFRGYLGLRVEMEPLTVFGGVSLGLMDSLSSDRPFHEGGLFGADLGLLFPVGKGYMLGAGFEYGNLFGTFNGDNYAELQRFIAKFLIEIPLGDSFLLSLAPFWEYGPDQYRGIGGGAGAEMRFCYHTKVGNFCAGFQAQPEFLRP